MHSARKRRRRNRAEKADRQISVAFVSKRWCCITELMDHVVNETAKAFEGSTHADDFIIFHDGLSLWWKQSAQQYLETIKVRGVPTNMQVRQLRCLDPTNMDDANYRGGVVGDSPELCRALDAHGFADLDRSFAFNCTLDTRHSVEDRTFNMGTPDQVWEGLCRTWTHSPTEERAIEDIKAFPRVLRKIIDNQGCVVPDEFLRTGRRAVGKSGKELKSKPRQRQRKSTLRRPSFHPSLQSCWDEMMGPDDHSSDDEMGSGSDGE